MFIIDNNMEVHLSSACRKIQTNDSTESSLHVLVTVCYMPDTVLGAEIPRRMCHRPGSYGAGG